MLLHIFSFFFFFFFCEYTFIFVLLFKLLISSLRLVFFLVCVLVFSSSSINFAFCTYKSAYVWLVNRIEFAHHLHRHGFSLFFIVVTIAAAAVAVIVVVMWYCLVDAAATAAARQCSPLNETSNTIKISIRCLFQFLVEHLHCIETKPSNPNK